MPGITAPFPVLNEFALANVHAMALAMVVLLQYVHALVTRSRTRITADQYKREVEGLSLEVLQLSRERGLQRLENQILREVLTQPDCQKAISHLLRRFIVNPDDAFGMFMPLDPASDMLPLTRGLTDDSVKQISLDHETLQKLREHGAVVWEVPNINNCPIYGMLSPADRKKARHLFLIGVSDTQGILGVLLASSLLPIAGTRTEQVDLTTRLMSSIAPNLRQTLEMERQSVQLRCTREMLELRSITDGNVKQPTAMLEKFLTRLAQMVDAERVVLYVTPPEPGAPLRLSVRCGLQMQPGVQQRWNQHEEKLAQQGSHLDQLAIYDSAQLLRLGIDTLVGCSAVIPLVESGKHLGVVCLTRRSPQGFSVTQRQLLCWAGESLSTTMDRAMSFTAIEKQAKQDGLTGLANRRTFDEQLAVAIADQRAGTLVECSLLLLDLDRFKSVNDIHGHQVGDSVLKTAADKIREQVEKMRSNDRALPARYGGEEMALLLPGVGIAGAMRIAENIRAALERHVVRVADSELRVTVSIGVAACPLHAITGEALIHAADEALYQAKAGGRNQVVVAGGE
jgi:diguanylate cyclase (GGDEF)-like protein